MLIIIFNNDKFIYIFVYNIKTKLTFLLFFRELGLVDVSLKLLNYLQTSDLGSGDVKYDRKFTFKPPVK